MRLVCRYCALHQFYEYALRPPGMKKDAAPLGGWAGSLVEQLCAGCAKLHQRLLDIRDFEADVVQPSAVLLQCARHTCLRARRLQQLDFSAVLPTERKKRYLDTFAWEVYDS